MFISFFFCHLKVCGADTSFKLESKFWEDSIKKKNIKHKLDSYQPIEYLFDLLNLNENKTNIKNFNITMAKQIGK